MHQKRGLESSMEVCDHVAVDTLHHFSPDSRVPEWYSNAAWTETDVKFMCQRVSTHVKALRQCEMFPSQPIRAPVDRYLWQLQRQRRLHHFPLNTKARCVWVFVCPSISGERGYKDVFFSMSQTVFVLLGKVEMCSLFSAHREWTLFGHSDNLINLILVMRYFLFLFFSHIYSEYSHHHQV